MGNVKIYKGYIIKDKDSDSYVYDGLDFSNNIILAERFDTKKLAEEYIDEWCDFYDGYEFNNYEIIPFYCEFKY